MEDTSILEAVLHKFEEQFKKEDKNQSYYHLVITGEYPRKVLDEVIKVYEEAGWTVRSCRTSSENGERPGLTGLQLQVKS